jgi:hypothetical protein
MCETRMRRTGWGRTHDDKRRAVLTLLNDPEWSKWSDREIARLCAVSHEFVRKLRPFQSPMTVTNAPTPPNTAPPPP